MQQLQRHIKHRHVTPMLTSSIKRSGRDNTYNGSIYSWPVDGAQLIAVLADMSLIGDPLHSVSWICGYTCVIVRSFKPVGCNPVPNRLMQNRFSFQTLCAATNVSEVAVYVPVGQWTHTTWLAPLFVRLYDRLVMRFRCSNWGLDHPVSPEASLVS